jgi:cation-transporting ATPase 13A2
VGRQDLQALWCVQTLEQIYLIYRGRYFYPVVIQIFTWPALLGMAAMLDQQRKKAMALMNECRLTPLVQHQWVRAASSHRLVPGDVVVLQSGRASCDMVLLRGACLVTEAVLSGEV